ncbi:MAG: STAS domain-containing protein [Chloroflexaceae bacterium]
MPLVGTIGPERAQQIMETLLEGVAAHQSEIVILDITGVQVVDEQVANALMRASQAVRLLGTRVVLTGIQPQIAQTLVQQEVDLSGITTHGTLQAGIATVLKQ